MKYRIRDIAPMSNKTINPQCEPDTTWHLYSLPSFDKGKREDLLGKDIKSNKFVVPNRCILYNKLNVRFKRVWRINSDEDHLIASTEFLPLVPNEDIVDYNYFYQYLISDQLTNYFNNQNSNTSGSHKRIDVDSFLDLEIDLPSPEVQKQIGRLISINDEISLNTRMNAELEAMAKQLYDYWFVQFDFPDKDGKPYKSSGGKMVYNEKLKREIPEGWCVKMLNKIENNIITGKTPSTSDESNFCGDIPFITIDDIRNMLFVNNTSRYLSEKGANSQRNKYLPEGSLCCSCIGTPGVIGFTSGMAQTNQQINSIVFQNDFNKEFLFFSLKLYFSLSTAKTGNILPNMNKEEFSSILVVCPPQELIISFHNYISPCFTKIKDNCSIISELTHLQDSLLPILMNGQVTVE